MYHILTKTQQTKFDVWVKTLPVEIGDKRKQRFTYTFTATHEGNTITIRDEISKAELILNDD